MNTSYNTLSQGAILHSSQYNYKIEKVLGQGAFGITYLANVSLQGQLGQLDSNVYVTIKEFFMKEINGREGTNVTSSSSSKGGLFYNYKEKFAREAKNLSKLKHPNIVNVMDYFEANNTCYYVMEYLSGGDLDTLIEKRRGLGEEDTIRFTKQIGSALSFMHQSKMLHLDLKPKNVMLNNNNDAILIDFGLSKQYDSSGEPESSTTVGRGTPGYAPLEQANYQDGHGFPVTMDVYALGATMYKMLFGVRAPEASVILNDGFPEEILQSHGVSEQLVVLVKKAMSPLKKDRYQQVADLINGLKNKEHEPTEIEIPIRIDSHTTDVRISYYDGPIPNAIRYEFVARKEGASIIYIEDWNEQEAHVIIKDFRWEEFTHTFNSLNLKCCQNQRELVDGGSITTIRLYNGESITINAKQQTCGISNSGNLVGNVNPLHKYICSIPEVNSLIENTRNQKEQPAKDKDKTNLLKEKSVWAFVFSILFFLGASYSIEWFLPFYALGGVLFVGLLTLISFAFKKCAGAFIGVGVLLGLLVGYLMNMSFVLYGIVGAGILITLTTVALYNKRNRWIVTTLILLGSLFIFYIWYSYNILQGHINDENCEVSTDSVDSSDALESFVEPQESFYTEEDALAYDGETNGYKWVDLGLPSGTKWAVSNIGAAKPQMMGDYYAWGETSIRISYTENNDYYFNAKGLNPSHDAACKKMGKAWRIPSEENFEELIKNCDYKLDADGAVFIGKNGHKLYFPFCGTKYDKKVDQGDGTSMSNTSYWTSTPWITDDEFFSNSGAKTFSLWKDHAEINQLATFHGLNIRAVTK